MGKPGGRKKKNAGVGVDFKKVKHKVRRYAGSYVCLAADAVLAGQAVLAFVAASGGRHLLPPPVPLPPGGQEAAAGAKPDGHQLQVAHHLHGGACRLRLLGEPLGGRLPPPLHGSAWGWKPCCMLGPHNLPAGAQ